MNEKKCPTGTKSFHCLFPTTCLFISKLSPFSSETKAILLPPPSDIGALLPESEVHVQPLIRYRSSKSQPPTQPPLSISLRQQSFPVHLSSFLYSRCVFVTHRALQLGRWDNGELVVLSFRDFRVQTASAGEPSPGSRLIPTPKHTYVRVYSSDWVLAHHVAIDPLVSIEIGCVVGSWVDVCPLRKKYNAEEQSCAVFLLLMKPVAFCYMDPSIGDQVFRNTIETKIEMVQKKEDEPFEEELESGGEKETCHEPLAPSQLHLLRFLRRVEKEEKQRGSCGEHEVWGGIPVTNGSILCFASQGMCWQSVIGRNRDCFVVYFNIHSAFSFPVEIAPFSSYQIPVLLHFNISYEWEYSIQKIHAERKSER